jgi:hypothetical protein
MQKIKNIIRSRIVLRISFLEILYYKRNLIIFKIFDSIKNIIKKKKIRILETTYLRVKIDYNFERPIFIWGCPRSGTTLLQFLLSLSPEIITGTYKKKREYGYNVKEGSNFWSNIFGNLRTDAKKEITISSIIKIKKRYVYELDLNNNKTKRLMDKIPFMINWVNLVDKVFPDAYHIHMIRNGLAVANSILYIYRHSENKDHQRFRQRVIPFGPYKEEHLEFFYKDLTEFVSRQWIYLTSRGQQWKDLLKERYIEVRYEDLTKNPEDFFKELCSRINIDFNKIDLNKDFIKNMNFKYKSDNFKAKLETKKKAIEDSDLKKLEIMKKKMIELGYKFEF